MSKMKLALDVVTDLRSLADSIENLVNAIVENQVEEETITEPKSKGKANKKSVEPTNNKSEKAEPKETADAPNDIAEPEIKQPTIEELRSAMADKNRDGHREEVKAILLNYGANKLTALDPSNYADVLKEVGELK